MANHHEQPDPQAEAQLEQLLKSGYADTPPAAEFQEALLRQLDQEYVRLYRSNASSAPLDSLSEVNSLQGTEVNSLHGEVHDPKRITKTIVHDLAAARPRRRIGLRLAMTMATAASLLFAVVLWNSQNAYGWASMLRALENCGWVQAVSETAGLSGWVSAQRGIVAIRSADKVAFHDHRQRTSSEYLSTHQVVYRQTLPTTHTSRGPEQLFGLLLGPDAELSVDSYPGEQRFEVVSETWRPLEPRDDQAGAIELRVTLRETGPRRKLYKVLALLDPESHLPKSCRLLVTERDSSKSATGPMKFNYPAEGPSSIFSLGIPRETEVVASLANLSARKGGAARDAVANRLLGQADKQSKQQATTRLAARPQDNTPEAATADQLLADNKTEKRTSPELPAAAVPAEKIVEVVRPKTIPADEFVTIKPGESAKPGELATGELAGQGLASNSPRPIIAFTEVPLPEKPLALGELVEQVNHQLAANWDAQGITPAGPANETEFLRRVYLDLTGRIPVPFEVYEFLEDGSPDRRERLVDHLLASRDHATHLASVWRKLLLPEGVNVNTYGGTARFDEWLSDRFEKNISYDQLVSQLLLAEGRVSDSGPILFYAALKLNPEELAAKTARTFLGMRLECAQCHDHKFDDSITQEDFWGFAAHFAQISRPRGKIEMTSSVLRVRDNQRGEVMLPDTEEVIPPRMPYEVKSAGQKVPQGESLARREMPLSHRETPPSHRETPPSRREILVDWLTTKQNSRFARATVNRAWQHLFGLGLVEPVDDMRADNPATCPEVLETLSLDFAASGYDLRRLLRTLVLSDAYQLSSRSPSDEPAQSLVFARMNIKSFSADQLYDCINVATQPEGISGGNDDAGTLARFGNSHREAFIEQFRAPPGQRTDYHAGIPQALTLMHGRLVHGATDLTSSGLLKSLSAPFMSDEQRVETLFLATLSRYPDNVEQQKMLAHLQAASGDAARSRALGDVLWALLNSAEFTFIH